MAVTLAVGLRGLTRVSIDRDETATIDIGTRTVPQIFHMIQGADAVHATYYVIMHYWMGWFGTSPTAIRIPSLVGVVIAAGALTLLGWHLLSRRAGITAGLLYACAPMISAIAHDARSYGLVSAVAVLTTYALVRATESTRRVAWIGYGVGVVALVLLHLLTVLILVAQAVTIAWYARRERDWRVVRRWLATVVLAAVPLLPLGYLALKQAGTAGWITKPTWAMAGDAAVNFAGGLFLIGPLVVLVALAYRRRPKAAGSEVANARTPSVLNVGLPWLLIPPILLMVVSVWKPLYVFRYVLYSLPALALLVAAGLDRLRWWLHVPLVIVLIAATVPMQHQVRSTRIGANDLRGEAAYIDANKRHGDGIVYLVPSQRFMSHSYPSAYAGLQDLALRKTQADAANFSGLNVSDATLVRRLSGVDRVWAVKYWAFPSARPGNRIVEQRRYDQFKEAGLHWVQTVRFRGGAILLFARKAATAETNFHPGLVD
jgi:mannosyltransferase